MKTCSPWLGLLLVVLGCSASTGEVTEAAGAPRTPPPAVEPARIRANGVELHFVERGAGEPIVFVHGGLMDYREWAPVAEALAGEYRTTTYSRRYNFPNDNPLVGRDHSVLVEAGDLAALIEARGLGPAHVVGVSYGGLTALRLAIDRPELVRSLVVVEPPLLGWLPDLPGGDEVARAFEEELVRPVREAFLRGDEEAALRATLDYFVAPGAIEQIPESVREILTGNLREWEVLTTSPDAFGRIGREEIGRVRAPVLVLSGERGLEISRLTDPELARLLPMGTHRVVPEGTHDVCSEQPDACEAAIRAFLSGADSPSTSPGSG